MTPAELIAARKALGFKTAAALGRALELEGRDPGRTVKRWENGETPVLGPARVAIRLMLKMQGLEAAEALRAIIAQPQAAEPPSAAPEPAQQAPKARRRG